LTRKLYICLPVLNEFEQLPQLLHSFIGQTYQNFKLIACVNQPEVWWDEEENKKKCIDNQKSLELLSKSEFDIEIIDKSSQGSAWTGKKRGVGWARKRA